MQTTKANVTRTRVLLADGIEAAAQLKQRGSELKIDFLTVREDSDFVRAALETGALG